MSARIYISNISSDVRTRDIQDLFSEYGRIIFIDIHGSSGYLEYEYSKDAAKAVENLDGELVKSKKISVEFAKRSSNNASYRNREKPNRARSQDKCYLCQEYGHWAINCPKGDGIGVSGGKCFKCNERGHIARKCPNSRRKFSKSYSKSSRSRSKSSERSRSRDRSRDKSRDRSRQQRKKYQNRRRSSSNSSKSKSYSRSESKNKRKSKSSRKYRSESMSRSVSKSVSYSRSLSKSRSKS